MMRNTTAVFLAMAIIFTAGNAGALFEPEHKNATQEFSAVLQTNKTSVKVGEPFVVTVLLRGETDIAPRVNFPRLKDFNVASVSQSQSFVFQGKEMHAKIRYTYVLVPIAEGAYEIPAVEVYAQKKKFFTNTLAITVLPGPAGSAPKGDEGKKIPRQLLRGEKIIL